MVSLEDRYEIVEEAYGSSVDRTFDAMWSVVDRHDGEEYQLRLIRKIGAASDKDLRKFLYATVRKMRRVLAADGARDLLVEIIDVVEDDEYIGSRMLDPGQPLSLRASTRVRQEQSRLRGSVGRLGFWRNIGRLAEALHRCHEAGIVHGRVSEKSVFTHRTSQSDYRLGGYESVLSVLEDTDEVLPSADRIVSFRNDWYDLGTMVRRLLGLDTENPPNMTSAEAALIDRLLSPPSVRHFGGKEVLKEIHSVEGELQRSSSSEGGVLVLSIMSRVLREEVDAFMPSFISTGIGNSDDVFSFIVEDVEGPDVRIAPGVTGYDWRLISDRAVYELRVKGEHRATIEKCRPRTPDVNVRDAFVPSQKLRLVRTPKEASELIQSKGNASAQWVDLLLPSIGDPSDEPSVWHALLAQEAFSLLVEQLTIFPVSYSRCDGNEEGIHLVISPREDDIIDAKRSSIGLDTSLTALRKMLLYDENIRWILSPTADLGRVPKSVQELTFEGEELRDGVRSFIFLAGEVPPFQQACYLRPSPDKSSDTAIRRRLKNITAAQGNRNVLAGIDDPGMIVPDPNLVEVAPIGEPPTDLDVPKRSAWRVLSQGRATTFVVGPPGVGKTHLVVSLVREILQKTADARILVTAQGHETLTGLESRLTKALPKDLLLVRVGRSNDDEAAARMVTRSRALLTEFAKNPDNSLVGSSRTHVRNRLVAARDHEVDGMIRDTSDLFMRAAHLVLATTNSRTVEEMVTDGEQFDWVIVEEAAKASGPELVGALLLGNRRVLIGDHNQLPPFGAETRQQLYAKDSSEALFADAADLLSKIRPEVPVEVMQCLEHIGASSDVRTEIFATATRLEQPFKTIVEREEERGRHDTVVTLTEQSRMHPAICRLISTVFYQSRLTTAERARNRPDPLEHAGRFPRSPIVVLDTPALSRTQLPRIETVHGRSYRNEIEAEAIIGAIRRMVPLQNERRPTLVILATYSGQVAHLKRLLRKEQQRADCALHQFESARADGEFVSTVDGFQGGEADIVLVSLVRNNTLSGRRALGFVRQPNRLNVLLSRARHRLVIATSLDFLSDVVSSTDPDGIGHTDLATVGRILEELRAFRTIKTEGGINDAEVITVDVDGKLSW